MKQLKISLNPFPKWVNSIHLLKTVSSAVHCHATTEGSILGDKESSCPCKAKKTSPSSSASVLLPTAPRKVKNFKGYEVRKIFYLSGFYMHGLNGSQSFVNTTQRGFTTRSSEKIIGSTTSKLREIISRLKSKDKAKSQKEHSDHIKTVLTNANLSLHKQQQTQTASAESFASTHTKKGYRLTNILVNVVYAGLGIVFILYSVLRLYKLCSEVVNSFREIFKGIIASEVYSEEINVKFNDVKGIDEAREELQQIVQFLRNPKKLSALGGRLPKGILLSGPPGTGKTLLARAVAGEANVPFFHVAGSEFDGKFVGQGAKRIKELFCRAKSRTPCVIFIDEIDSVGAKRVKSSDYHYANDTINQLLVEMDGFTQNSGVIVLAATNRRGDLDNALLRPGRFDVEITVPIPDMKGRLEILRLYLSQVKVDGFVNVDVFAKRSIGFTGADLKNLIYRAAMEAATEDVEAISMPYLERAYDKMLMGPELKSRIPDDETNLITAYHEAGRALVSLYTKNSPALHKVTIVPHGPSPGHSTYITEKENSHCTKSQLLSQMDTLMGGRAAEELIFGRENITSGAADDLKQATVIAVRMVKQLGMSDKVGVRVFEGPQNSVHVSLSTAELIDTEINQLLAESLQRAKQIVSTYKTALSAIANALLKYESLDAADVKSLTGSKE